jgi:hypothetical protein
MAGEEIKVSIWTLLGVSSIAFVFIIMLRKSKLVNKFIRWRRRRERSLEDEELSDAVDDLLSEEEMDYLQSTNAAEAIERMNLRISEFGAALARSSSSIEEVNRALNHLRGIDISGDSVLEGNEERLTVETTEDGAMAFIDPEGDVWSSRAAYSRYLSAARELEERESEASEPSEESEWSESSDCWPSDSEDYSARPTADSHVEGSERSEEDIWSPRLNVPTGFVDKNGYELFTGDQCVAYDSGGKAHLGEIVQIDPAKVAPDAGDVFAFRSNIALCGQPPALPQRYDIFINHQSYASTLELVGVKVRRKNVAIGNRKEEIRRRDIDL